MGSLAAALASWLDARAHEGKWLIRIENIDPPRERSGAAAEQLTQLARYGMRSDEPIWFQSERFGAYESALQKLRAAGFTYYCRCTRGQLGLSLGTTTHHAYPGSCRDLGLGPPGSVRFRVDPGLIALTDRACGRFEQDVAQAVGDFVLRRSDGLWAYQLAVVLDDAAQGITDVVRGADLLDNTPRQMLLQRALGLPKPRYLHVPLVLDAAGRKLSKQDRAQALGNADRVLELEQAWQYLGFARTGAGTVLGFQDRALAQWSARFGALDPAGADAIEASLAGTRVHVAAQEPS